MMNHRELIDFLSLNKLSLEEYFIIYLFACKDYASYYKYGTEVLRNKNKNLDFNTIKELEERKFLKIVSQHEYDKYIKYTRTKKISPNKVQPLLELYDLHDDFAPYFIVSTDIAVKEIFERYPKYIKVNNISYPALTSFEEFKQYYYKKFGSEIYKVKNLTVNSGEYLNSFKDSGKIFYKKHARNLEAIDLYKTLILKGSIAEMKLQKFFDSELNEYIFNLAEEDDDSFATIME